jgi:hypothetical protein
MNYWKNGQGRQERESEEREEDVRGPRAKVSSWPTEGVRDRQRDRRATLWDALSSCGRIDKNNSLCKLQHKINLLCNYFTK